MKWIVYCSLVDQQQQNNFAKKLGCQQVKQVVELFSRRVAYNLEHRIRSNGSATMSGFSVVEKYRCRKIKTGLTYYHPMCGSNLYARDDHGDCIITMAYVCYGSLGREKQ